MALVASSITVFASDSIANSYSTVSVSPASNSLLLLAVQSSINTGTGPNTPTVTGLGLTWVQIDTLQETTNNVDRLTLFRALGTVTPGVVTADFGGEDQKTCSMTLAQITGMDGGGTNGSAAIIQSASNQNSGTNTGLTVTLGAFSGHLNGTFGAVVLRSGVILSISPGSGFTEVGETGGNETSHETEFLASNDTSVDWSWSSGTRVAIGIAVEIKIDPASTTTSTSSSTTTTSTSTTTTSTSTTTTSTSTSTTTTSTSTTTTSTSTSTTTSTSTSSSTTTTSTTTTMPYHFEVEHGDQ